MLPALALTTLPLWKLTVPRRPTQACCAERFADPEDRADVAGILKPAKNND